MFYVVFIFKFCYCLIVIYLGGFMKSYTLGFRVNEELKNLVIDRAEEKNISESQAVREIFMRGLELDDLKQERIAIETLCLLRRWVLSKDVKLFDKAKEDAEIILVNLGIEKENNKDN